MSSDRELLEMAAKAVGLTIGFSENYRGALNLSGELHPVALDYVGKRAWRWHPLDDDKDAFRLLVSLNLSIQCPGGMVFTDEYHVQSPDPIHVAVEIVSDDPAKALRRAIVRVAAELGREMKS